MKKNLVSNTKHAFEDAPRDIKFFIDLPNERGNHIKNDGTSESGSKDKGLTASSNAGSGDAHNKGKDGEDNKGSLSKSKGCEQPRRKLDVFLTRWFYPVTCN